MIQRGEVWWAALPQPIASEPGFRRPIAVIQSQAFNRSRIQTVIGVVLTSNLRLEDAPGNVRIPQKSSGLPRDSVANVSQIISVDRTFLVERAGRLQEGMMTRIGEGLRLVLGL